MQDGVALERKNKDELKQIALGLEVPKVSAMKKEELIVAIREARSKNQEKQEEKKPAKKRPADVLEVCGVLDVMSDGFGFLRFDNYRPGENDVYVSPTQIRRFNLKTGDEILGDCRP